MRVLLHAGLSEPRLSEAAVRRLRDLGWKHAYNPNDFDIDEEKYKYDCMILEGEKNWMEEREHRGDSNFLHSSKGQRHDPLVLQVFDEMGQDMFFRRKQEKSWNDLYPEIVEAVEIPDGTKYEIMQGEGSWESIHEVHRVWTCTGGDRLITQGEQGVMKALL